MQDGGAAKTAAPPFLFAARLQLSLPGLRGLAPSTDPAGVA